MNMTTKKITTLGMLCGLAVIVNLLIHFPLIPSVEFLSYDAKDVINFKGKNVCPNCIRELMNK